MSAADLAFQPMHVSMRALAEGRLTAAALTEACLDRIARYDARLHAFVATYATEARLAAGAADAAIRAGHRVGPFHGIPVAVKDLVDIEGRVTTSGSRHWERQTATATATLVRKLIGAGMIVIGKTHTCEFAMSGWGTNEHLGTPWNPWDPIVHRTPGGSSSGSAVAVAAGLVPVAIGTDTGGSVRTPAAWCGHVGLKVTIGRISTSGVFELVRTLDTVGPMTRSVEDAALLFDLLHGPDAADPLTLRLPRSDVLTGLQQGVRGLRLARLPAAERAVCDAAVLAAYDAALATLVGLGAEVADLALPRSFADYVAASGRIMAAEDYYSVGHLVDDPSLPLDSAVRPRIQAGRGISAKDYLQSLDERDRDKRAYLAAITGVDALLTPTLRTPAIPLTEIDQRETPAYFTRAANYLEQCALALPDGFTQEGLPLSLQIIARGGDEATALRIGFAYEQATAWHTRRPPGL